jgi:hypothetical protein
VVLYSLAAFLVFNGLLGILGVGLLDFLIGYLGVAGRGAVIGQFFIDASKTEIWLSVLALFLVLLPLGIALLRRQFPKHTPSTLIVSAGTMLAGINSFLADGEMKVVSLALCAVAVHLLLPLFRVGPSIAQARGLVSSGAFLFLVISLLAGIAIAQGYTRHRVMKIGYGSFFLHERVLMKIESGFFRGLKGSSVFHSTIENLGKLAKAQKLDSVFFGPRLQFAYAAHGIPSPMHQPVWWHPGTSFPKSDEFDYVRRWMQVGFRVVVLLGGDTTYYTPGYVDLLSKNYRFNQEFAPLIVGEKIK